MPDQTECVFCGGPFQVHSKGYKRRSLGQVLTKDRSLAQCVEDLGVTPLPEHLIVRTFSCMECAKKICRLHKFRRRMVKESLTLSRPLDDIETRLSEDDVEFVSTLRKASKTLNDVVVTTSSGRQVGWTKKFSASKPQVKKKMKFTVPKRTVSAAKVARYEDKHARILLDYLHGLWKEERLTDVIIRCDMTQYSAHSIILSAYSEYFHSALSTALKDAAGNYVVETRGSKVSDGTMAMVLQFLYTGTLNCDPRVVGDAARKLGIPSLAAYANLTRQTPANCQVTPISAIHTHTYNTQPSQASTSTVTKPASTSGIPVTRTTADSPVTKTTSAIPSALLTLKSLFTMESSKIPASMTTPKEPVARETSEVPAAIATTDSPVSMATSAIPVDIVASNIPVTMETSDTPATITTTAPSSPELSVDMVTSNMAVTMETSDIPVATTTAPSASQEALDVDLLLTCDVTEIKQEPDDWGGYMDTTNEEVSDTNSTISAASGDQAMDDILTDTSYNVVSSVGYQPMTTLTDPSLYNDNNSLIGCKTLLAAAHQFAMDKIVQEQAMENQDSHNNSQGISVKQEPPEAPWSTAGDTSAHVWANVMEGTDTSTHAQNEDNMMIHVPVDHDYVKFSFAENETPIFCSGSAMTSQSGVTSQLDIKEEPDSEPGEVDYHGNQEPNLKGEKDDNDLVPPMEKKEEPEEPAPPVKRRYRKKPKQYIPCEHCGKKYQKGKILLRHIKNIHILAKGKPKEMLKCEHCSKEYRTMNQLAYHVKVAHILPKKKRDKRKMLKCGVCGVEVLGKKARELHIKSEHRNEERLTCPLCRKWFMFIQSAERHMENCDRVSSSKKVKPQVEPKPAKQNPPPKVPKPRTQPDSEATTDQSSSAKSSTSKFSVQPADSEPTTDQNLSAEPSTSKPPVQQADSEPASDKRPSAKPSKSKLKKKSDPNKAEPYKGPFPCEICGKLYSTRRKTRAHVRYTHIQGYKRAPRVDKGGPYLCDVCGKSFDRKNSYVVHKRKMHLSEEPQTTDPDLRCPTCHKQYPVKNKLTDHIKRVHSQKAFICSVCGSGIKTKEDLRKHMYRMHGIGTMRSYDCAHCGKIFFSKKDMEKHIMAVHEGRRWPCDLCGQSFKYEASLVTHTQKLHSAPGTVFRCQLACNDVFHSFTELENHRKSCPYVSRKGQAMLSKATVVCEGFIEPSTGAIGVREIGSESHTTGGSIDTTRVVAAAGGSAVVTEKSDTYNVDINEILGRDIPDGLNTEDIFNV